MVVVVGENFLWISRPNEDTKLRPLAQVVFKLKLGHVHWATMDLVNWTMIVSREQPMKVVLNKGFILTKNFLNNLNGDLKTFCGRLLLYFCWRRWFVIITSTSSSCIQLQNIFTYIYIYIYKREIMNMIEVLIDIHMRVKI